MNPYKTEDGNIKENSPLVLDVVSLISSIDFNTLIFQYLEFDTNQFERKYFRECKESLNDTHGVLIQGEVQVYLFI